MAEWLNDDRERHYAVWRWLSSLTAEMLTGEGRVYGGGLHKLEPKELGNVCCEGLLGELPDWELVERPRQLEFFDC